MHSVLGHERIYLSFVYVYWIRLGIFSNESACRLLSPDQRSLARLSGQVANGGSLWALPEHQGASHSTFSPSLPVLVRTPLLRLLLFFRRHTRFDV